MEKGKSSVIGQGLRGGFGGWRQKTLQGRRGICNLCQSHSILLQGLTVRQREGSAFVDQVGGMLFATANMLVEDLFIQLFIFLSCFESLHQQRLVEMFLFGFGTEWNKLTLAEYRFLFCCLFLEYFLCRNMVKCLLLFLWFSFSPFTTDYFLLSPTDVLLSVYMNYEH